MSTPIKNELSLQIYGDKRLEEKLLQVMGDLFDADVYVKAQKPYTTKSGKSGYYMNVSIKVNPDN